MSHSPDNNQRADQRETQDKFLAEQARVFDGTVAENTDKRGGWRSMKYERPSFIVVTASEAYREGWEKIFAHESKPEKVALEPTDLDRPAR